MSSDLAWKQRRQPGSGSVLRKVVIRVTIEPPLSQFRRCDHRMTRWRVHAWSHVVRRIIAAQCRSALLTRAKVNPPSAYLDALLHTYRWGGLIVITARSCARGPLNVL